MPLTDVGRKPSRALRMGFGGAALLALAAVGYADFVTDAYLSVDAFYVLPVLLATWGLGRIGGTAAAFAGTLVWALPRIGAWPHITLLVWAWNLLMRWGLMEVVAVLLARARSDSFSLRAALDRAPRLPDLLPICAWCGKLRNSSEEWQSLEQFLASESQVAMTHGICGTCSDRLLAETHRIVERE